MELNRFDCLQSNVAMSTCVIKLEHFHRVQSDVAMSYQKCPSGNKARTPLSILCDITIFLQERILEIEFMHSCGNFKGTDEKVR